MTGDCHVRICGSPGVRFPRATRPAFSQCSRVSPVARGTTRVELVIGGMSCAACAARVQARLNKTDGVAATVNYATGRARVTAPARVSARELMSVVEAAGYSADVAVPAGLDAGTAEVAIDDATVRRLRRRLILALVFFVPLTDLSIVLSVFPWSRFPGWQWLMVALAAPVATWAAWPFHQAALKQARHLSSSMDTLVSLGILAACGWSVYAMFFLDRSRTGLSGLQSLLHNSGGGIYLEVAASVTTTPSDGSRPASCRRPSVSWCAPESGSPPTARCCPASPRWTGA